MMKMTVKRLGAAVLALCMMLSMMISASAVTKYYLELEITDAKENISVKDTSAAVSLTGDNLAETMVSIVAANIDGTQEENWKAQNGKDYGLYVFESTCMRTTIHYGLKAYEDGQWADWVNNTYTSAVNDGDDLKTLIVDLDKKVGELELNKGYVMTYTPVLAKDYENDPAYGNTYTFTVTLVSKNITTGGGTAVTPEEPSYRIYLAKVDNATVKLSSTDAKAGDKVTVTVTADEGYKAESVAVATGLGASVLVADNGDGTYTFVMPEGAITVTVAVKEDVQTPGEPDHSSVCKAKEYSDVDLNAWYHNAVCYVLDKGYMSGFNATEFGPNKTVTRAMVAQIFYNMENTPAVSSGKEFPDVAYGQWYYNAITWAAANGVVSGYGDGTYQPDKSVSREELAQMFFNYAKAKGLVSDKTADLSKFADAAEISAWAEAALSWGVGAGLMSGKGGNNIDANGSGVRAEIAQMIMNYCENIKG